MIGQTVCATLPWRFPKMVGSRQKIFPVCMCIIESQRFDVLYRQQSSYIRISIYIWFKTKLRKKKTAPPPTTTPPPQKKKQKTSIDNDSPQVNHTVFNPCHSTVKAEGNGHPFWNLPYLTEPASHHPTHELPRFWDMSWYGRKLTLGLYIGTTPHPVTVTTRTTLLHFLIGNPYKPSFVTVTGWGVDLTYINGRPPKGSVLEGPMGPRLFQGNLGWWNIPNYCKKIPSNRLSRSQAGFGLNFGDYFFF